MQVAPPSFITCLSLGTYLPHTFLGGTVLLQFLRHGGLPTLAWKRAARAEDGATVNDLH